MENFNSGHRLSACSLTMLALGITKGYNENDYSQRKGNEQKTDKEWNILCRQDHRSQSEGHNLSLANYSLAGHQETRALS